MKIIRKTTKIIPMLTITCLLLLSLAPFGVGTNKISASRVIPAGSYLSYSFGMEEDDKLDVSFEVTLGGNLDIDLWVVDSANFLRFEDGDSFYYKFKLDRYVSYDFQFKAEDSDTYYVIFSNIFSVFTSKTVEIDIEYIAAPSFNFISGLSIFLGVGVLALIIYAIMKPGLDSKKTSEKVEKKKVEESKQDLKLRKKMYCSDCGAQLLEENTNYCPYCGKFQ